MSVATFLTSAPVVFWSLVIAAYYVLAYLLAPVIDAMDEPTWMQYENEGRAPATNPDATLTNHNKTTTREHA